jgi:hypothetical protein
MEKCTLELGNLISVEPKDFINLWDEMRQNVGKIVFVQWQWQNGKILNITVT